MSGTWVKHFGPEDAPVLLYCVAHAGGGGGFFRPWARALAPGVGVRAVVLPGRESRLREPAATSMAEVVAPLAAAVEADADRPYALFGHSMGAAVAYEVARVLNTGPRPPLRLLVSGRRPPHLPARFPPLHRLGPEEFLDAVVAMGGTPRELVEQPDLVRVFLPGLRADFTLNETYRELPGAVLDCPVSALTGVDDPQVDAVEIRRWADVTTGALTVHSFPGGHFYHAGPPDAVAVVVREELALPVR
ncbi:thioesterase II family protein [Actinokineospora bangkokensis]|uniref:Thioesterase n=1 Tax=Actinokineospora bangkokensis TaxID=1193682 RepID=A0A1Q9LS11_9PSEU|nr:alpha/beta fold hydrolase [Actinokineospora bangkokensis]OLR94826.1 thioesterase [Actinokineospora bangkokensis]